MGKKAVRSLVVAGLALAWGVSAAQAQTGSYDPRDLSGYWRKTVASAPPWAARERQNFSMFASEMPLQPWAQEHCRKVGCGRGVSSAGEPRGNAYYQGQNDPVMTRCAPYGFPRILLNGGITEIIQVPDRVFMRFYINSEMREIWMDGREHPEDPQRPWMGHSTGRWDGNTLAIDTVGLIGGQDGQYKWLDHAGTPHSDDLHVVERIQRTEADTLDFSLLFEDPRTFTAPIRGKVIYGRESDPEELAYSGPSVEYVQCEDRIYADRENEAWPFFSGDYPVPQHPPAGPDR